MSKTDKNEHATVRVKSPAQAANGTHQVAHVYLTKDTLAYAGHELYKHVKPDKPPSSGLRSHSRLV